MLLRVVPVFLRPTTTASCCCLSATSTVRNAALRYTAHLPPHTRTFTSTPPTLKLPRNLPPRAPIPESDYTEKFLHGSGPGGQKINKTSSAVQLKHLPTGIVVKCQETRSRSQNRKLAMKALQEAIEEHELGDMARTRLKGAEKSRKKANMDRKKRKKYRALEAAKNGEVEGEAEEGVEGGEGEDMGVDLEWKSVHVDKVKEGKTGDSTNMPPRKAG